MATPIRIVGPAGREREEATTDDLRTGDIFEFTGCAYYAIDPVTRTRTDRIQQFVAQGADRIGAVYRRS